jgi:ribosome biogenesis SPOUT family RNA methylase Rps3
MITLQTVTDQSLNTDRTSELRKKGYQGRRLGPVQMTTDTAVRVTRIVVQDKGTAQRHRSICNG